MLTLLYMENLNNPTHPLPLKLLSNENFVLIFKEIVIFVACPSSSYTDSIRTYVCAVSTRSVCVEVILEILG